MDEGRDIKIQEDKISTDKKSDKRIEKIKIKRRKKRVCNFAMNVRRCSRTSVRTINLITSLSALIQAVPTTLGTQE